MDTLANSCILAYSSCSDTNRKTIHTILSQIHPNHHGLIITDASSSEYYTTHYPDCSQMNYWSPQTLQLNNYQFIILDYIEPLQNYTSIIKEICQLPITRIIVQQFLCIYKNKCQINNIIISGPTFKLNIPRLYNNFFNFKTQYTKDEFKTQLSNTADYIILNPSHITTYNHDITIDKWHNPLINENYIDTVPTPDEIKIEENNINTNYNCQLL